MGGLLPSPGLGPGVPVLCLYSTGVKTPLSFYYAGADWAKDPATTFGDGDGGCIVYLPKPDTNPYTYPGPGLDSGPGPARLPPCPYPRSTGTVNRRSLRVCEGWGATQPQPVRVQTFDGIDHQGMIKDARVIQLVLNASRM